MENLCTILIGSDRYTILAGAPSGGDATKYLRIQAFKHPASVFVDASLEDKDRNRLKQVGWFWS